jgi:chitinase
LNYAFQNPDASGNLAESNSGLTALVSKAHQSNVKVLVSMGGASSAIDPIKSNYQNLISSSEKRATFISKILEYLDKYKLDGFDLDEEGSAINADYAAFVKQLSDSLKSRGLLFSAAVGWGAENIPNSVFQYFDFINLMSYDLTGSWDLTHPGQHSPYWYAQKMIRDYKNRGVVQEQICLGVPFYGYGFYKKSGSFPYQQILELYPEAWTKDQVGDTIYYNGTNTIWRKTKLALSEASGVMIWELSSDATGDQSLLKTIASTVDSAKVLNSMRYLASENIKIFPNPASDYLFVVNLPVGEKTVIRIYSILGKLIKSQHVRRYHELQIPVNISGLSEGTYVCTVSFSGKNHTAKFLKE